MAAESSNQVVAQFAPVCPCEGKPMKIAFVSPKAGPLPELWTFRCEQCGHVETIEARTGDRQ
jgi:hypothetical protein